MSPVLRLAMIWIGSQHDISSTSPLARRPTPFWNPSQKVRNWPFFFQPIRNSQTPWTSFGVMSDGFSISILPDSFR